MPRAIAREKQRDIYTRLRARINIESLPRSSGSFRDERRNVKAPGNHFRGNC